jgi:hypothetical protein
MKKRRTDCAREGLSVVSLFSLATNHLLRELELIPWPIRSHLVLQFVGLP